MDMSAFSKADELKKRLWFTVLALIVFRLGTFIPLPGIDVLPPPVHDDRKIASRQSRAGMSRFIIRMSSVFLIVRGLFP